MSTETTQVTETAEPDVATTTVAEDTAAEEGVAEAVAAEDVALEDTAPEDTAPEDAAAEEGVADAAPVAADRPRGPAWRSTPVRVCAVIALLALVAGGVFAGMGWHLHRVDTARAEAQQAGVVAAQTLLTYDYRTVDTDVEQRLDGLTGDFRDRYQQMVRDGVAPVAKERQVVTTTTVVGSSVVGDEGPDEVRLLLFLNQSSEAPALAQPLLTGSRIVMTLQRVDGRWLTANLEPV